MDRKARSQLAGMLDKFQTDRMMFFERVPEDAPDYDKRYLAFVQTYIDKVKAMVPNPREADVVVERFVYDGRIIKKSGAVGGPKPRTPNRAIVQPPGKKPGG